MKDCRSRLRRDQLDFQDNKYTRNVRTVYHGFLVKCCKRYIFFGIRKHIPASHYQRKRSLVLAHSRIIPPSPLHGNHAAQHQAGRTPSQSVHRNMRMRETRANAASWSSDAFRLYSSSEKNENEWKLRKLLFLFVIVADGATLSTVRSLTKMAIHFPFTVIDRTLKIVGKGIIRDHYISWAAKLFITFRA